MIAVAIEAGCQAFLTNDALLRRVGELRILVLEDLEV
jgi:predicted nucleic acid-binding protein